MVVLKIYLLVKRKLIKNRVVARHIWITIYKPNVIIYFSFLIQMFPFTCFGISVTCNHTYVPKPVTSTKQRMRIVSDATKMQLIKTFGQLILPWLPDITDSIHKLIIRKNKGRLVFIFTNFTLCTGYFP